MRKFTRFIAPALAAGMTMMAAAPAQANYSQTNYYEDPRQIRTQLRQFERQLGRVADRGQLSERNATWLSYRLQGVERQFRQFSRRGFNDWEMSTLNHSLEILHTELDRRSRQGNRRGQQRGYRQSRSYDGGNDYRRGRASRDDRGYRRGRGYNNERNYRRSGHRDD